MGRDGGKKGRRKKEHVERGGSSKQGKEETKKEMRQQVLEFVSGARKGLSSIRKRWSREKGGRRRM